MRKILYNTLMSVMESVILFSIVKNSWFHSILSIYLYIHIFILVYMNLQILINIKILTE